MKRQIRTSMMIGLATLSIMLGSIPFSKTPAVAWWSVIYPSSLYDAGVLEKQETAETAADSEERDSKKTEKTANAEESSFQIKWKLAELVSGWF